MAQSVLFAGEMSDLTTTNVLFGILAAAALLEATIIVASFISGFLVFRRTKKGLQTFEEREVTPLAKRVNAILDDVQGIASTVKNKAGRLDRFVEWVLALALKRGTGGDERYSRRAM